jgi:hypothetical protein
VTPSGSTPTFSAGGTAVDLSGSLSVTDREATSLAGATVSITGNFLAGDTLAATTAGTGITASYNGATGVLTLSGSDTVAHYQAVLDGVTYSSSAADPTAAGTKLTRTISWQASDSASTGGATTSTVNVRTPAVIAAGDSVTFTNGGAAVTVDAGLTLGDVETGNLTGATVSISGGFLSGDVLHFTNQFAITGSYDGTTGVLTLSGTTTLANYQTALRSITFSTSGSDVTSGGSDHTRTLSWQVTDDKTAASNAATSTVTVNDPPVVTPSGTPTFTAGGTAVDLSGSLSVTDREATSLTGATVSITGNFLAGDTLAATTAGTSITAGYNSTTGVLTLSGSDTVAHYQAVLDSVTYSSSAADPTNAGAVFTRTISWQASDSASTGAVATSTVNVRTPPVTTAGGSVTFTNGGSAVVVDAGLALNDVETGNFTGATVSISGGFLSGDVLHFTNQFAITGNYNSATGVLTLSGTDTLTHYQTALASITFSTSGSDITSGGADHTRTLSWQVTDDKTAASNTATSTVTVNDPPVVTPSGTVPTFSAGGAAADLSGSLTVTDREATSLTGATVSITGNFLAGDTLAATTAGTSITASYNSATGVLTLSGSDTAAHYQAVLDGVTYASTAADPTAAGTKFTRTISWQASDSASTGSSTTSTVNVRTPPVITAAASVTFTNGGTAVTLDGSLALSDVETGNFTGATVSVSSGFLSGDALNFTNQNGITGSYNGATGVLTLTGTATLANYRTALESITFSTSGSDITSGGSDRTRTLSWQVTDDKGATSGTAISTVTVNDPPVLTPSGAHPTFNAGDAPLSLDGGLTLADHEASQVASAAVSISGNFLTGDTLAATTGGTAITPSYNGATGVLTLSGTDTVAHYQAVLHSITYFSSAADPTSGGAKLSRTVSLQITDVNGSLQVASNVASVSVDVRTPPVVTAGASATFNVGGAAAALDAGLTLSDAQSANLTGATVAITSGLFTGDTLNFTNQAGITGSYNSGTGVLTLSGTASVANYQSALASITYSSSAADPSHGGTDPTRTLSWSVSDSLSGSNTATSTLVTNGPAPTVTGTSGVVANYVQQGSAVTLDSGVTAGDVDSATLAHATVSIASGLLAGDTLSASTAGTAITASYNSTTGVLTLSGSDTIAHYTSVLRSVTYSSSAVDPTSGGADSARTISWQVDDGKSGNNLSAIVTSTLDTHVRPAITAGAAVIFTTGGGPVLVDAGLTATDADSNAIVTATVKITGGLLSGDVLAFNNGTNTQTFGDGSTIVGSYNTASGTLTLSVAAGTASAADFQMALRSVTFVNTSASPDNFGANPNRTLTWTLDTGLIGQTSVAATSSIVLDPPAIGGTSGIVATYIQGGSAAVLDGSLTVTDLNSPTLTGATVSITANFLAGDTLAASTAGTSITASFNSGTGVLTLSGSDTVAHYQAVLDGVTYASSAADPTSAGSKLTRTISWQANDSASASNTVTTTVNVRTPPAVTAGAFVTFTAGGPAVALDPTLGLTDVEASTITGATISVSGGFLSGDTLHFTNQNGITGSYNGSTGVLTLTGTASVANYRAALESITFSTSGADITSGGSDRTRTFSWQVTDSLDTASTSATSSAIVNDPPVVTPSGAQSTFNTGGVAAALDASLALTDHEASQVTGAVVSITGNFLAGDTLAASTTGTSITASYNGASGVLTLSGSDTVAHYQAVLDGITYSSSASDPTSAGSKLSRTVSLQVTDVNGPLQVNSNLATVIVDVRSPPVVTAGAAVTFTASGAAVAVDAGLALSDAQSANLTGATVAITSGLFTGDTLNFTSQNGITGSYNSATGLLTLSGTSSVAHYQAALASITFGSGSADPTHAGANLSRTLSWTASDSLSTSAAATSTVNVRTPPVLTAGASVTFTAGGSATVIDAGLALSDVETGNFTGATVAIGGGFLNGDTLSFTNQNGISGSYNGSTGVLTLSGTASVANYQTALASITFSTSSADITSGGSDHTRTLSWQVTDDKTAASNTATSTVTVNDPPVVTPSGATPLFNAGGAAADLSGSLTVTDREATSLTGATVSITANFLAGDTLAANTTGTGIIALYNSATGVLTLSGSDTVAHYQAVLDGVTYASTAADPTAAGAKFSRTISWQASDSAGAGSTATSTVNVRTPPVLTAGASVTFTNGGVSVIADSSLALSDVETGNLTGATVSVSGGFLSGDVLHFTNQNGIAGNYNSSTGLLTLVGTATVANYQQALGSITFSTSGSDITSGGSDHTRTLSWTATDSIGAVSNAATSTVTVNDPPVVTPSGATPGFSAGGTAVTLSGSLTVTDREATILTGATVSITANFLAGDLLAANTTGTAITALYNSATGVLSLSGSDTAAHYQAVLDGITYASSAADPTHAGTAFTRTISWQLSDSAATGSAATSTVNVRTPPALTAGASVTFTAGGTAVAVDAGLALSDVETGNLTGATVSISGGFLSGDALNFTNQNAITGSYNSSTGVLTLSGTDTLAHYQAALASITFSTSGSDITSGGADHTRTLSWQVTDDKTAASNTATSTVTVNDPPAVTPSGTTPTYSAGGSAVDLSGSLSVTDHEAASLTGATVSITANFLAGDSLAANTAGTGITALYNSATGVLTLSGTDTVAHYQAVLDGVTYSSGAADPTNAGAKLSRTISWQASDAAAAGSAATSTVNVRTPPVVTAGASATFNVGGAAVALDAGLTLSDAQSANLTGATVAITAGLFTGDTLNFANQNGITGSYSSGTGVLTLSGTASVASYQAALASITYSSSAADPSHGGADPSRTVSWSVSDSLSGSNTATSSLVTNGPAPTVSGTAGVVANYIQQASPVTLDSAVTAGDVDSATLVRATVSISSGLLAGDTLSASTAGTNITASYNAATGVLTLSGSDTVAHYTSVLQGVTYSSSAADPTNGGADRTRTISWQVDDGKTGNHLSSIVTSTLATHVLPVITAGGTITLLDGDDPMLVDATVTVADADTNPVTTAKVAITSGMVAGDTLAFNNGRNTKTFADGSTITGTYNANTGVLTLTAGAGPAPTTADFQQALQSVTFANATGGASAQSTRVLSWTVGTADPNQTSLVSTSRVLPPPVDTGSPGGAPPPVGPPGLFFPPTVTLTEAPAPSGGTTFTFTFTFPSFEGPPRTFSFSFTFDSGVGSFWNSFEWASGGMGLDFDSHTTFASFQPYALSAPQRAVVDLGIRPGPAKQASATPVAAARPTPALADREPDGADRGPIRLVVDNDRPAAEGFVAGADRPIASEAAPAAGKLGLSAQLRAAGRQGLLNDRQALLNSLRGGLRG